MQQFANNYPQLMNQAVTASLAREDLALLKAAFDFTQLVANGFYRAQGIPLLNHLVRTASIVLSETRSVDVVATALLHACFTVDKFDHSRKSPDLARKRKDIARLFGSRIEQQLLAYDQMAWYYKKPVQGYIDNHASLTADMKDLLLVRLANELEDHLDFAMAYTQTSRTARRSDAYGAQCVELARTLGFDLIADNLATLLAEQGGITVPDFLVSGYGQGYALNRDIWPMTALQRSRKALAPLVKKYLFRRQSIRS